MSKNFVACDTINTVGTSFQGVVKTTYDKIVNILGEPTSFDASPYEKVNAQWSVQMKSKDKTKFTVYNWKDGYVPTEAYDWHIGGFDIDAYYTALDVLDK